MTIYLKRAEDLKKHLNDNEEVSQRKAIKANGGSRSVFFF